MGETENSVQTGLNFTVNHTDSINDQVSKIRNSDIGSAKFGQESETNQQREYISPSALSRIEIEKQMK
jgi:hypothetical protein